MTYTAFFTHGTELDSRWLITCDHATNFIPPFVNGGDLGLPPEDMERHIAFDPGAYGVARALGDALAAPVVASNFSRLVIDPNRGEDDPTLLMKLYDGTIIPANRHADEAELEMRLNRCHRPYHDTVAELAARRDDTVIVAIHSFTPQLRGRALRPWEIGILYPDGERLSPALIDALAEPGALTVGDNEPYTGYLPGDAIDRHGTAHGRPNTLVELRNDLIATAEQQTQWAQHLAKLLPLALASAETT